MTIVKEWGELKRIFTLQKPGARLTSKQQEGIKNVLDKYDFKNFTSLKRIELKDINDNSFVVEVEEIDADWTKHLSRLLEIRVHLFEHKENNKPLFNSNTL